MRKKKSWYRWVAGVLAGLLLLILLGSLGLYATKRRTCQNYGDVWTDMHLLLSQREDGTGRAALGHRLNCLWVYLSSNSMDSLLYEWRWLVKESAEQGELQISYLSWKGQRSHYGQTDGDGYSAAPTGTLELVRGHTDRSDDAYVHGTVWYLLDAYLLCEDGDLVGYVSRLQVNRSLSESEAALSDQQRFTYTAPGYESARDGEAFDGGELPLGYATELWLAGVADK